MAVHQERGEVVFELMTERNPGLGVYQQDVISFLRVRRWGSPELLWAVEVWTGEPATGIMYGVVPDGFRPTYPQDRTPDPLEVSRRYTVSGGIGMSVGRTDFTYVRESDPGRRD